MGVNHLPWSRNSPNPANLTRVFLCCPQKRHHVLQTVHPSPLSVNRGFFGCRHFSKTNEFLKKSGKKPIDWKAL